jgi:undecaprenyl-diphosphatase
LTAPTRTARINRAEAVAFIGGALALATSWVVVAAQDTVPGAEVRVFELLNGLPGFLWPLVWLPMQAGSLLGSLVIVSVAAVLTRDWRVTLAAFVASQAAFWIAKVVKSIVSRGRPTVFLSDIHVRERADGFGYVSGHTAVAFALGAALAPSVPRRVRPAVWAAAVVVGFGRIYGGVHLPLDVVGGAGIGLLLGTLTRWALGLGGEGLPTRPLGGDAPNP